jgi:hypothetical protein
MKRLCFTRISLSAVVFAAIAAVVTWALDAPPLTVVQSAAATFGTAFGLGFAVYHFFRTP